jgi:hypothetical protein
VLLDGQLQVVVVGCLLDHRDLVDALCLQRQLRADSFFLGAARAFDDQRNRAVSRKRTVPI